MANYAPMYSNSTTGLPDVLDAGDGLTVDGLVSNNSNDTVNVYGNLAAGSTLNIGTSMGAGTTMTVGASGMTTAVAGAATVGQTLTVTQTASFNGHVNLGNASGDNIIFNGEVDSDITFGNGAARAITIDSQNLSITTTTSGNIVLNAVGAYTLDADSSSTITVTTGNLIVRTLTSGNLQVAAAQALQMSGTSASLTASSGAFTISGTANSAVTAGAGADLTLGGRGSTIALNDAGNLSLSGFTATTILGALNELRGVVNGDILSGYLGEAVTTGDVVSMDWEGVSGRTEFYLADKDTAAKRRAVGVALSGGVANDAVTVAVGGTAIINSVVAANNEGEYLFMDNNGAVTLTPPAAGQRQIVGQVWVSGGAGTAEMLIQIMNPTVI